MASKLYTFENGQTILLTEIIRIGPVHKGRWSPRQYFIYLKNGGEELGVECIGERGILVLLGSREALIKAWEESLAD